MSDTYIHRIDNTIDSVKTDFPTSVKSVAKAVHEINKYKRITEAMFNDICGRFKANPDKCEVVILGTVTIENQRQAIWKHIVNKRSITDLAIRRMGCFRPDKRMAELEAKYGIQYNRREVTATNGTEFVRYELRKK